MRIVRLVLLLVCACDISTRAVAQEEGDKVVVVSQRAPLRSLLDTTGSVGRGAILLVRYVDGDWYWVYWSNGSQSVKGWINRKDVVPYSEALDFFNRELQRQPTALLYSERGMIWNERGEHDKAIRDYDEAIRLDPGLKQFYNNRGVALVDKRNFDKAIADFDRAIEIDGKFALAFNNRGNVWAAQAEYGKAVADYNEAIRLDPKDASAFYNRGHAWSDQEEYDRAIPDYSQAIRLDPKDDAAYKNRGEAWSARGQLDRCLPTSTRPLSSIPNRPRRISREAMFGGPSASTAGRLPTIARR